MQHNISSKVDQHRCFQAILPEEIAESYSHDTVEKNSPHNQYGGQLDQRSSGRQMPQAKDDCSEDVGKPQGSQCGLASRQMPGKADEPGQERE
nr:hypothetical protein [Ktedonosporobacter rubrisoli]